MLLSHSVALLQSEVSEVENEGFRRPSPKRQRPEHHVQAAAMNCGYWTRGIALRRVPEHFHSCSPSAIVLWRLPSGRVPWAVESPLHWMDRHLAHHVQRASLREECDSAPRGSTHSTRCNLGFWSAKPWPSATSGAVLLEGTVCIFWTRLLPSTPPIYARAHSPSTNVVVG